MKSSLAYPQRHFLLSSLFTLALLHPLRGEAQVSFDIKGPFASGPRSDYRTQTVAVGDIDEDGRMDLVATNYGPPTDPLPGVTAVLWGESDSGFSAPQTLGEGVCPNSVALADLDGDAHLDIVAGNQCGGMATIFWGDGTRSPHKRQDIPLGNSAARLGIADLDGDNDPDIVATDESTDTAWVLWNNGKENFSSQGFPTCPGPGLAAIAQLDGREGLDLFITGFWTSTICFLFNDGFGNFSEPVSMSGGSFPARPGAVGDFTGDGLTDVAFSRRGCFFLPACQERQPDGLAIYAGNGNGGFSEWAVVPVGKQPSATTQGDFNFDGRVDVVVANEESNTVSVLLGQDGGGLIGVAEIPAVIPSGIAVADVNKDQKPDFVIANSGDSTVSVVLQQFSGGCDPIATMSKPAQDIGVGDRGKRLG